MADIATQVSDWFLANQNVLQALVLIILAPIAAWLVGDVLAWAIKRSRVHDWLKKHDLQDSVLGISPVSVLLTITRVVIFLIFLQQAAVALGTSVLSSFINGFVVFMVQAIRAVLIASTGFIVGDYVADRIKAAKAVPSSNVIGIAVEVFIGYVTVVMALREVYVDTTLLITFFNALVWAVALAVGLGVGIALGLGLKDTVSDIAEKKKGDIAALIYGKK
jgi:hypothetical protein